jgi:hypothetical protein
MRYRLMATYRGVPYEVGLGPSNSEVVLFAACPPPEELGFEPATGHWRKPVIRAEIDALWESRPVGVFRGEPCIVLDDPDERLHIAYLGTDADRAASLGYWQVDRGVFELLTQREEVSELTEERVDKPLRWGEQADVTGPTSYPYGMAPWPVAAPPYGPQLLADAAAPETAPPIETAPAGSPLADVPPAGPQMADTTTGNIPAVGAPVADVPPAGPPMPDTTTGNIPAVGAPVADVLQAAPTVAAPTVAAPTVAAPATADAATADAAMADAAMADDPAADVPVVNVPQARAPVADATMANVPLVNAQVAEAPVATPQPAGAPPGRSVPRGGAEPAGAPSGGARPETAAPPAFGAPSAAPAPAQDRAQPGAGTWTTDVDAGIDPYPGPVPAGDSPSSPAGDSPSFPAGAGSPALAVQPGCYDPVSPDPASIDPVSPDPASTGPVSDIGGRAARRQRVRTREIFCELADLAAIPRAAYALETETDGTMCLLPTPDGFEVFYAAGGARHELRSFAEEEAAYFYLFGILAAEAIRSGGLVPAVTVANPRGGTA